MTVPRILIVSDNGSSSASMSKTLSSLGYQIFVADDGTGASEIYKKDFYSLVVIDLERGGIELVDRLRRIQTNLACVFLVDPSSTPNRDAENREEIRRILCKSVDIDELIDAVEEVLCRDSLKFDQQFSGALAENVTRGEMVRGDRPVWCEVCGYSTHWHHTRLMRYFCSNTCVDQYQTNSRSE